MKISHDIDLSADLCPVLGGPGCQLPGPAHQPVLQDESLPGLSLLATQLLPQPDYLSCNNNNSSPDTAGASFPPNPCASTDISTNKTFLPRTFHPKTYGRGGRPKKINPPLPSVSEFNLGFRVKGGCSDCTVGGGSWVTS